MNKKLYSRILRPPGSSFFLLGVRGVGKSTWAKQQLSSAFRIDLLDEGLYQRLLASPNLFGDMLRPLPEGQTVVVDEIQRIPGLLNEVHRFIEDQNLRFALLGSSARKLKTEGTNLLAGRALWKTMLPLLPEELGQDFDLEHTLRYGTVPLIRQSDAPEETLQTYVQLYLREEIKAEALVRNLPAFLRFLPIAGLFHGATINIAALARDSGSARSTVSGYLEILEDTLLAWRLPAYEARLRARERKHPKLYLVDPGVARAVKRHRGPLSPEERGALLEGWIHTLLRAYGEERQLWDEISYWAPLQSRGLEVDFILQRGREILALEVKAASNFSRSQLSGLKAMGELPHVARRLLVYTGREELRVADGIEVVPVQKLLELLETDQLWP